MYGWTVQDSPLWQGIRACDHHTTARRGLGSPLWQGIWPTATARPARHSGSPFWQGVRHAVSLLLRGVGGSPLWQGIWPTATARPARHSGSPFWQGVRHAVSLLLNDELGQISAMRRFREAYIGAIFSPRRGRFSLLAGGLARRLSPTPRRGRFSSLARHLAHSDGETGKAFGFSLLAGGPARRLSPTQRRIRANLGYEAVSRSLYRSHLSPRRGRFSSLAGGLARRLSPTQRRIRANLGYEAVSRSLYRSHLFSAAWAVLPSGRGSGTPSLLLRGVGGSPLWQGGLGALPPVSNGRVGGKTSRLLIRTTGRPHEV